MPSKDITFCADGEKCPKRKTCYRFMCEHGPEEMVWVSNLYEAAKQSGKPCGCYIKMEA